VTCQIATMCVLMQIAIMRRQSRPCRSTCAYKLANHSPVINIGHKTQCNEAFKGSEGSSFAAPVPRPTLFQQFAVLIMHHLKVGTVLPAAFDAIYGDEYEQLQH